jgi:hypothetical protein
MKFQFQDRIFFQNVLQGSEEDFEPMQKSKPDSGDKLMARRLTMFMWFKIRTSGGLLWIW